MEAHGYRFRLMRCRPDEATREVSCQYRQVLLSSVVASGGLLADQAFAATLSAGSVSALVFAGRFVSVVTTLFAGAISSALVPYFSTMIAQQDWRGCRNVMRSWVLRTAAISIPLALALIAGSRLLVRLTLQHGAFAARDTAAVAPVLALYAVQIPFFAVSRVFYRFVVAMRRSDLVLYCGIINLILDVVLDVVLMHWLGVAGLALATSIWTACTCAFLYGCSRRVLEHAEMREIESAMKRQES